MPQLQLDAEGREIQAEINVQLAAPDRGVAGAQCLDVNKFNAIMRATSERMNDPGRSDRIAKQHVIDVDSFEDLDGIISNLEYAGKPVPPTMIEQRAQLRLQCELSYAQITGKSMSDADADAGQGGEGE